MHSVLPIRLKRADGGDAVPFECTIRRRRGVRRLILRVGGPDTLTVTAPARCARAEIERFVQAQSAWVFARLEELEKRRPEEHSLFHYLQSHPYIYWEDFLCRVALQAAPREGVGLDAEGRPREVRYRAGAPEASVKAALIDFARRYLPGRVETLKHRLIPPVDVARVSVRDQRSRWGSCSARRTISLNWRLVLVDADLRDYVILHELAHRVHMNHSAAFWNKLVEWMPDALLLDKQLTLTGGRIMRLGRGEDDGDERGR